MNATSIFVPIGAGNWAVVDSLWLTVIVLEVYIVNVNVNLGNEKLPLCMLLFLIRAQSVFMVVMKRRIKVEQAQKVN